MNFHGYRNAEAAAVEQSRRDPSQTYYVNWIEDNEWCVDTMPELDGQPAWKAGVRVESEPLLDTTTRAVWITDRRDFKQHKEPM